MIGLAIKMLVGERAKYAMLISGICFATILMVQGLALGFRVLSFSYATAVNIRAPIWVAGPLVETVQQNQPLRDTDVYRVRSVSGVAWAAPLYVGGAQARVFKRGGLNNNVTLVGLDTETLAGAPDDFLAGSLKDLRLPDAVIVDRTALTRLSPDPRHPLKVGQTFEMNNHRAQIVGVVNTLQSQGVQAGYVFTTFDRAVEYALGQPKMTTFVLAAPVPGQTAVEVARRISAVTGLRAFTEKGLWSSTERWMFHNSPLPFIIGLIVGIGFLVGTIISGQTFFTFILENTRYLGVLRAMGTQSSRLAHLILVQAMVVGLIGYGLGAGSISLLATLLPTGKLPLVITWQILTTTLAAVLGICAVAAWFGIRRMARIEPAIVFRF